MLDERFSRQIIEAWNADQAHPLRRRPQRAAPDLATVRAVVDAVFLTSIRTEEGRPILPSVGVLDPSHVGDREIVGGCLVMPLSPPVPLTVSVLEKLSPAVDPATATLAVTPASPSDPNLSVWAILLFGGPLQPFGRPSVHNEFSLGRADVLTVRAESPGSLLIARGGTRLGSLAAGTFILATPTPFIERGLGQFVMAAVRGNEGNTSVHYWHVFSRSVMYLLEQLSARTHGASLILLPSGQAEDARPLFRPRYGLTIDLRIPAVLRALLTSGEDASHLGELLNVANGLQLCERLRTLAQLAAVDGALVVSASLDVLGFGTTLEACPWSGRVLTGPDGFGGGGEPFDVSRLGTRHNSAVNFVGACTGSVAFVVSQDGPIRAFVKRDENTVLCWPDCRASMFV